jgi:hypothetical protein
MATIYESALVTGFSSTSIYDSYGGLQYVIDLTGFVSSTTNPGSNIGTIDGSTSQDYISSLNTNLIGLYNYKRSNSADNFLHFQISNDSASWYDLKLKNSSNQTASYKRVDATKYTITGGHSYRWNTASQSAVSTSGTSHTVYLTDNGGFDAPVDFTTNPVWTVASAEASSISSISTSPVANGTAPIAYSFSESASNITINSSTGAVTWIYANSSTSTQSTTVTAIATNAEGTYSEDYTVSRLGGPGVSGTYSYAQEGYNGGTTSPTGSPVFTGTEGTWSISGTGATINSSTGAVTWSNNTTSSVRTASVRRTVTRNGYARVFTVGTSTQRARPLNSISITSFTSTSLVGNGDTISISGSVSWAGQDQEVASWVIKRLDTNAIVSQGNFNTIGGSVSGSITAPSSSSVEFSLDVTENDNGSSAAANTTTQIVTAPDSPTTVSDDVAEDSVTVTVASSGGSNGTLHYAQTSTNIVPTTGWQTGATFSQARGTTKYYWASNINGTISRTAASKSLYVGYLLPDTSVTATSSTISNTATTTSTTIAGGSSNDTYAVRVNNGTDNLGTVVDNGDVSFTDSLPSAGTITTYEIFAARSTASGGDGLYDATNDTFTVGRQIANIATPTASHDDANAGTVTVTLSDVSVTGGTTSYAQTATNVAPTTGWQSSSVFTQTRNTTSYYWARATSSVNTTVSSGVSLTVDPRASTLTLTGVTNTAPNENTSQDLTADYTTYDGVTVTSYAWSDDSSAISLSDTTTRDITVSFGNVTAGTTGTVSVICTDSLGATITKSQAFTIGFVNQPPVANIPTSNEGNTIPAGDDYEVTATSSDPDDAGQTITTTLQRSITSSTTGFSTVATGTSDAKTVTYATTAHISGSSRTVWYRTQASDNVAGVVTSSVLAVTESAATATTVDITSVEDTTPNENTSDQVTATVATDPDVSISSYAWTTTGALSLSSTTTQSPIVYFGDVSTNSAASVTVIVTDSLGRTATDTQTYTIQFVNQGPSIGSFSASPTVAIGNQYVTLSGSSITDVDGTIASLDVVQTEGTPVSLSTPAITGLNTDNASITRGFTAPNADGTLVFRLTAADNNGVLSVQDLVFDTVEEELFTPSTGEGFQLFDQAGALTLDLVDVPLFFRGNISGSISTNYQNDVTIVVPFVGCTVEDLVFTNVLNSDYYYSLSAGQNEVTINVTAFGTPQFAVSYNVTVLFRG